MTLGRSKIQRAPTRKLVVGVALCWLMLVIFVPGVGGSLAKQHAAASWPCSTATVTQSHTTWRKLFSRRLHFTYEYEVGGRMYSSSTRRLAELTGYYLFRTESSFAAAHPVGSTIQVWYDPAAPRRATIGVGVSVLDVIVPLVFLAAIAVCSLEGTAELWRRMRRAPPDAVEDRRLAEAIAEANAGQGRPAREVVEEIRRARQQTIDQQRASTREG
jgi:hypothetical protein